LEIIFANLDGEHGKDKGEFNIQFITYTSKLDGGIQRYLLATPNEMKKGKKYPLVVIVRPHVDHHYHFFTSPQFTHQWAINIIQSLANSHGFIVMLPEARMYHNEDLTPFAEAEMKLAIEDVKKHYKIDEERMYLHGICSGGYRALRMATENPGMFAALGLYTPIYHEKLLSSRAKAHSIENLLPNLAGTPIMIHADPFDKHTPYKVYADLISDCKKYGIPLTYSVKRNTELLYNAVVAGSEAFDFFDGKVKSGVKASAVLPDTNLVVADLYSKPFVYVYNSHDHSAYYKNMVHTIQGDYKEYMNTDLPLITEDEVDEKMLKSKNVFLIGHVFENPLLVELVDSVKREESDLIDEKRSSISIHRNTLTQKLFVISSFTSQDASYFKYPWIDGMERVLKSDSQ
jgi:predicted esterase